MSPYLAPALRDAAARHGHVAELDGLLTAAAHRIDTLTTVNNRLVAALARARGRDENVIRLEVGDLYHPEPAARLVENA